MLVKANAVIGLKVIAVKRGKHIADVKDIIYDPQEHRVKAFLIQPAGWFSDARIILFEGIKSIGKDAVMVESEEVIRRASDGGERVARIVGDDKYLTKEKIITENGTHLGQVNDLYFDSKTGRVESFEVVNDILHDFRQGKKRIEIGDVVTIGEDAVIVKNYLDEEYVANIKDQEEKTEKEQKIKTVADLNGAVSESVSAAMKQVLDAISEAAKMPTSQDIKKKIGKTKKKSLSIIDGADEQIKRFKEQLRRKIRKIRNDSNIKIAVNALERKVAEARKEVEKSCQETLKCTKINQTRDIFASRKRDVVGKYLTKNLLLSTDEILAKRGDMITHNLLKKAQNQGLLEQVLINVSNDPIV